MDQNYIHGEAYRYNRYCHLDSYTLRYRRGPVPGTTKPRGGYNGYRYPKTKQELSYHFDPDIEDGLTNHQIARLQKTRWVPHAWDDIPRSRQAYRNWKRYRYAQYRG